MIELKGKKDVITLIVPVGEDFVPRPASCLSSLGSQTRKVLFSVPSVGFGIFGML